MTKIKLDLSRFWYFFLIIGLIATGVVSYFYFSNQKLQKEKATPVEINLPEPTQSMNEQEDKQLDQLQKQSDSDEIAEIEKDATATDLDNLDQEVDKIKEVLSQP